MRAPAKVSTSSRRLAVAVAGNLKKLVLSTTTTKTPQGESTRKTMRYHGEHTNDSFSIPLGRSAPLYGTARDYADTRGAPGMITRSCAVRKNTLRLVCSLHPVAKNILQPGESAVTSAVT